MSIEALRELPHPALEPYMMSNHGLSPRLPMLGGYLPSPYIKQEPYSPYLNPVEYNHKLASMYHPPTINFDIPRKEDKAPVRDSLVEKVKVEAASPVPSKDSLSSSHSTYERALSWDSASQPSPYPTSPMFDGMHLDQMKRSMSGQADLYFCHLCSYSGTSKFQFNEHMNSHFDHTCPYCDYTSRTEGRLKRHIKDFHTDDTMVNVQRTIPGRPKLFRCKQCDFIASDKVDYWTHARTHIKDEKLLQCPKCEFVTEYKHHLEYHLRNHFGSKPFKCEKCNYACVNKSMLNSHMKSHTNVYQYRCADCTYATKYCHSLKLHLRKYNHKPATILNPDGSLPQGVDAETSGVSLLAKRGPPRGPRGPRKDRFESYINGLVSMPHPSMSMPRSLPMNGGMMNPFWPYLGQFPAPGYPPNPSMMYPMSRGLCATANSPILKQYSNGSMVMSGGDGLRGFSTKCNICGFMPTYRDDLATHMVQVHAAENKDLFKMFGISSDSLSEGRNNGQMKMTAGDGDDSMDGCEPLLVKTDYEPCGAQSCPLTWPSDARRSSDSLKYNLYRSKSLPDMWSGDSDLPYYDDPDSIATSPDNSPKRNDANSSKERPDSPKERGCSPKGADILKQMTMRFGSCEAPFREVPLDLTKPKSYLFPDATISPFNGGYNLEHVTPASDYNKEHTSGAFNPRFYHENIPDTKVRNLKDTGHKRHTAHKEHLTQDRFSSVASVNRDAPVGINDYKPSIKQEIHSHEHGDASALSPLDEYSPKRKQDESDSGHDQIANMDAASPSPRKRSRKGKAYKLDTLCWKLKGMSATSPYDEFKKDEFGTDEEREAESDECAALVYKKQESPEKVECDTTDERNPTLSNRGSDEQRENEMMAETTYEIPRRPSMSQKYRELSKINNIINQEILHGQTDIEASLTKNLGDDNQTPAIRRGTEIAWKILHPTETSVETHVDGTTEILGQTTLPMCTPPALIKADTVIPYSDKLNGLNLKEHLIMGKDRYECTYCDIAFRDCVMYTMHMGYHGYRDPYQCNMCGHQSKNRVDFFLHIARAAHA